MEHILFLNVGYPLEPLCRALRAGGAVSTVTESLSEWQHLSSIRPWSLCVVACESLDEVGVVDSLPDRVALLTLAEDVLDPLLSLPYSAVWQGGVSASSILRAARFRNFAIAESPGEITLGQLIVNVNDRTIWWEGEELMLTPRQFAILRLLSSQPGRIFSRTEIWEHCWGLSDYPESNAVDAHVRRMRKRLPQGLAISIITAYGIGYRLLPYSKLGENNAILTD